MIWLAYLTLALESLVIAIGLWLMWTMISEASRTPTNPFLLVEHPQELPALSAQHQPEHQPQIAEDTDPFILQKVDERGYMSSRKLHMGCEAGVCRTPLGARIVAGTDSLAKPQYAWEYASVEQAIKALLNAEFDTHPREGIIGVEDEGGGSYVAAEPEEYLRRWRYTTEGRMERF